MNNWKRILLGGLLAFVVISCDDIIEKDISDQTVILRIPGDSVVIKSNVVSFWWEESRDNVDYLLQVVSPSFDQAAVLWVDTLMRGNTFTYEFAPGQYQWRVRPQNSAYEGRFATRTFTVDTTSDLSKLTVRLLSPTNDLYTNKTTILFEWSDIRPASEYLFQIHSPLPEYNRVLTDHSLELHFEKQDAEYTWSVTAMNTSSMTKSIVNRFIIDVTPPLAPAPLYPETGFTFETWPVYLTWERVSADVAFDSLFVYKDDGLSLFFKAKVVANPEMAFTSAMLPPGVYYWTVRCYDRAGNESSTFTRRNFSVQGQNLENEE
jgi:hypothetical protein